MATMVFANVQKAPPDPIQELTKVTRADKTADKVDIGAGVYRDEDGQYAEFDTLRKAGYADLVSIHD